MMSLPSIPSPIPHFHFWLPRSASSSPFSNDDNSNNSDRWRLFLQRRRHPTIPIACWCGARASYHAEKKKGKTTVYLGDDEIVCGFSSLARARVYRELVMLFSLAESPHQLPGFLFEKMILTCSRKATMEHRFLLFGRLSEHRGSGNNFFLMWGFLLFCTLLIFISLPNYRKNKWDFRVIQGHSCQVKPYLTRVLLLGLQGTLIYLIMWFTFPITRAKDSARCLLSKISNRFVYF